MVSLSLRFDVRNPAGGGVSSGERFLAAVEMAAWADRTCGGAIVLSEHHGTPDGYLPSPLTLAAAIAVRTERLQLNISAAVAPFYDPLRLAEDAAVVDLLSRGRLSLTLANGYVVSEFEMFDVDLAERAKRTTEVIHTLRQAWTGDWFEFRGRRVRVTPTPHRPGGPPILLGGRTAAAARRAARLADGFSPETPEVWDAYRHELRALGKADPGPRQRQSTVAVSYLCTDVEAGWDLAGRFFLDEEQAFAERHRGSNGRSGYEPPGDVTELRRSARYRVMTPADLRRELQERGPQASVSIHPMIGGIPPDLAWTSLHLFETEVLRAL